MNVLEKILEEIDNRKSYHEEKLYQQDDYEIQKMYCDEELDWITNIIRSHMDEAKDTNVPSNDDDYTMFTLNKDGVAEIYRDTYDIIIHCGSSEEEKRVRGILERCNGWISVEERLPEVQKELEDAYCPEFNVMIKGAEIATTLNYSWDGTWFDDIGEVYDVVAWQPLPEPYKTKKTPAAEHIMSRFTRGE